MAWPVPWDKLDPEMVEVVRLLNETGVVKTTGCCAGHHVNEAAEVALSVTDDGMWETRLLPAICSTNESLRTSNVWIYKRYFTNYSGRVRVTWFVRIEPHPNCKDVSETRERVDRGIDALEDQLRLYLERESEVPALQG